MDKLTWLEGLLLDTLRLVAKHLDQQHVTRREFGELRGEVTQAIKRAENVEGGCSTGVHRSYSCHCQVRKVA
jgi:hypothetical protein